MSYCRVMVPQVPATGSKVPEYHWSTSCRLINSGWTSRISRATACIRSGGLVPWTCVRIWPTPTRNCSSVVAPTTCRKSVPSFTLYVITVPAPGKDWAVAETTVAAQIPAREAITSVIRAMLRVMRILLSRSFEDKDRIASTSKSHPKSISSSAQRLQGRRGKWWCGRGSQLLRSLRSWHQLRRQPVRQLLPTVLPSLSIGNLQRRQYQLRRVRLPPDRSRHARRAWLRKRLRRARRLRALPRRQSRFPEG